MLCCNNVASSRFDKFIENIVVEVESYKCMISFLVHEKETNMKQYISLAIMSNNFVDINNLGL